MSDDPETSAAAQLDYKALYKGLMRHIPEGVAIAEASDVRILAVSAFGQKIIGRSEKDLSGKPAGDHPAQWQIYHLDGVTLAHPDELPLTRATVKGEIVENEEWIIRRPDGSRAHVSCNASPIRDETGALRWGIITWRDVTAIREAEDALARERQLAIERKDLLLHETNHRVKNNLSVISAILRMQAQSVPQDSRDQFYAAAQRVAVLGKLYEQLAYSEKPVVGAADYMEKLAHSIEVSMSGTGTRVSITAEAQAGGIPTAVATDVGLIANELLTNACKHGRSADGSAAILLQFSNANGLLRLVVEDRGKGWPEASSIDTAGSLGMKLVRTLVRSYNGTLECSNVPGARVVVTLPLAP